MTENRKAIFFGNGLNRINGGVDWEELLKSLAKDGSTFKINSNTLRYEAMYLSRSIHIRKHTPLRKITEYEIKEKIAEKLKEEQQGINGIYKQLANLPISEYITTNYDYSLELTLQNEGYEEVKYDKSEKIYSIHRYRKYSNGNEVKRIWHIHGDLVVPQSIMLGYDHYCGSLAKINEYMKGTYSFKHKHGKRENIGKIEERLRKSKDGLAVRSWIDLFFAFDIDFIGYGLDLSEIDIWWVLNKRMRILKEQRAKIGNDITFHTIENGQENDFEEKCKVLETFGVECKKYQHSETTNVYATLYGEILNGIYDTNETELKAAEKNKDQYKSRLASITGKTNKN